MLGRAGEIKIHSLGSFSHGLEHMDTSALADLEKFTFISSVWSLDAIERIYWEWWQIGMDGVRELRESILLACHNDDDDD